MPNPAPQPEKASAGEAGRVHISMDQVRDYEFRVRFDKDHYPDLLMDEPPPLGKDTAPNAARILGAAVGNCLTASLLFCMRKARADLGALHTEVTVRLARNEQGRLRIAGVEVEIDPRHAPADQARLERCLGLFEDFCVVTQSVRQGIDVQVRVKKDLE